jgi:hypothetical protein
LTVDDNWLHQAVFAEMAAALEEQAVLGGAEGSSSPCTAHYAQLCRTYGHFVSANGSVLCPDPTVSAAVRAFGPLACTAATSAPCPARCYSRVHGATIAPY